MHAQLKTHRPAGRPRAQRAALAALATVMVLVGCGGVKVAPTPILPHALVAQMPARVGVVVAGDMRNFTHKETRGGVEWIVTLGPGLEKFAHDVFAALFPEPAIFVDMTAARAAKGLVEIFEPRIEQFSFATAQETGGNYFAVTIRYRINLATATGEPVDSFTLTGYGNSQVGGMSSGAPLEIAARAAMRDAAAKFLVQFPEQPAAKLLAATQPLVAQTTASIAAAKDPIEAMPIK